MVQGLSLSGADLPLLQDAAVDQAELAMVIPASPIDAISRPVAPPDAQPMTEVESVEPQPPAIDKPKPQVKPKRQQARNAEKPRPAREPTASAAGKRSAKGDRASGGTSQNGGRTRDGAVGSERAATSAPGNPRPEYPRVARSRGHEGRVLIRVSVLGNGRVGSATVAKSSGHGSLDRAALKAVKRWRFTPALRAGRPVTATLTVPVTFRLEG